MNFLDHSYFIIGGTTKAGSTSLYRYLSDHPDVCGSSVKETCFFLDLNYPLKSKYRFEINGIDKYNEFFKFCGADKLRLEATPDYLYSNGCAERITSNLRKIKMLFILRDPVERLFSWYRFAKQDGKLPQNITFDKYVNDQMTLFPSQSKTTPQYMRTLEQGLYANYLNTYFESFQKGSCMIVYLEELQNDPLSIMNSVCLFAGLNSAFYKSYQFKKENPTNKMRFPKIHGRYKNFCSFLRSYTHNRPIVHSILKTFKINFDKLYFNLNVTNDFDELIPEHLRHKLEDFYRQDWLKVKSFNSIV